MHAPSGKMSSERPSSNACLAILSPTSKYSLPPCTSSGMVCSAFSITSRRTAASTELFLYASRANDNVAILRQAYWYSKDITHTGMICYEYIWAFWHVVEAMSNNCHFSTYGF